MGYKVPDWKKSIGQNKFPVEIGSNVYEIPKAEYLTGAQAEQLQNSEELEGGIYAVLNDLAPGLGDELREIPVIYVKEFVAEWQKDSGITLGESGASSS